MNRLVVAGVALGLTVGLDAGCSSYGSQSSGAAQTSPAAQTTLTGVSSALCSSVSALKTSVSDLSHVNIAQNGVGALGNSLATVKTDVQQVVDTARDQYRPQALQVQADWTSLQAAIADARDRTTTAPAGGVVAAVRTLANDVGTLAHDVASSC